MKSKSVDYSKSAVSHVMLPSQANYAGNIHGGEIMKMMDTVAYVVARKHARSNVVTARVDELKFHLPIYIGELVTCKGQLVFVGKSSLEVFVDVEVEDLDSDLPPKKALTAYFTMVALDKKGKPTLVPKLNVEGPDQQAAFDEGRKRYESYKSRNA